MKCHFVHDKKVGKILIPGCLAVVISYDKEDCTCYSGSHKSMEERVSKIEEEIRKLKLMLKNQ